MLDCSGLHRTGSMWESELNLEARPDAVRLQTSISKLQVTGTSSEDLNLSGIKLVQCDVLNALISFFEIQHAWEF